MIQLRSSPTRAVNLQRHADMVIEKATERALYALSIELRGGVAALRQSAAACVDLMASLGQRSSRNRNASRTPWRTTS